MKFSVGFKIGFACLFTLLMIGGFGLLTFRSINVVNHDTRNVAHSAEIIDSVDELQNLLSDAEISERSYLMDGRSSHLKTYWDVMGRESYENGAIKREMDELKGKLGADSEHQDDIVQLEKLVLESRATMGELIALRMQRGATVALQRAASIDSSSRAQIRGIGVKIKEAEDAKLQRNLKEQDGSVRSTLNTVVIGVPLVLIALAVGATMLIRDLVTPLKDMAASAERAALGDLSRRVQGVDRGDEVGVLARAFNGMMGSMAETSRLAEKISEGNLRVEVKPQSEHDTLGQALERMVENLQNMVQDLGHASRVIGSSSTEMASSSVQMAASSSQTSAAVVETSATVGEVRQTAEVASQEARQVAERARQAAQAAREGREATESAGEGMLRIRDQMNLIANSMMRLSEQSQAISEIISTVDDLTQQSNLLAVNAAIEAAKAGERGKGFAVVAQEVRSLAEQSRQATTQVRAILTDVQKATSAAVLATEQGTKSVEDGLMQFGQAGGAIRVLDESVADAAQSAAQIAMSSQEQLVGMEQLAQAIDSIKQASQQNVESARQLEDSARDLSELGRNLQHHIERYVV